MTEDNTGIKGSSLGYKDTETKNFELEDFKETKESLSHEETDEVKDNHNGVQDMVEHAQGVSDDSPAVDAKASDLPSSLVFPDPGFSEAGEEPAETQSEAADEQSETPTLIEGAWADILGSGQLKKKILKHGKSKSRPQSGDTCKITFSGCLSDGTVVDSKEDFEFTLGDSEVIHAFDLIVALMELGEKCQAETSPRFAYGEIGFPPVIPPNSTLLYEIELLGFRTEDAPEMLSLDQRRTVGNTKRERGNWWYSRNDFSKAIISYRRALDFLDAENESADDPPEKLQQILEDRLKVYNNMAAAQLKVEAYDAAIKSLDVVLKCQPMNVKALYRKGKVFAEQGKISDAIGLYKRALSIEPNEKSIKNDLAKLESKQKKDRFQETSLYKKMLGTPVAEKKTDGQTGYDKVKLTVPWTLMVGSIVAFATSYLAYKYRYA